MREGGHLNDKAMVPLGVWKRVPKRKRLNKEEKVTGRCFAEHRAIVSDDCPLVTKFARAFDFPKCSCKAVRC